MRRGKKIEIVKDPVRVEEIYNKHCEACRKANARCIFTSLVDKRQSCIKCAIAWMLNHYDVKELKKND